MSKSEMILQIRMVLHDLGKQNHYMNLKRYNRQQLADKLEDLRNELRAKTED